MNAIDLHSHIAQKWKHLFQRTVIGLLMSGMLLVVVHDLSGQQNANNVREQIEVIEDLAYASTDNPKQTLHLVVPKERTSDDPLPLVVFIHGGAWRAGDKRGGIGRVSRLVASGDFVGASIGYRLTGEAIWPAQIHDCKAAIRWLKKNASEYGYDPDRIAVMGSSAGGHLVCMLGTTNHTDAFDGELGDCLEFDSKVSCVVDLFGPTELLRMNDIRGSMDHDAPNSPESVLVGGPLQTLPEVANQASPITHVDSDCPPFLIVHGQEDFLVPLDQSLRFHRTLRQNEVPSVLIQVRHGRHGGFQNPEIDKRIESFLRQQLRGEKVLLRDETIDNGRRS